MLGALSKGRLSHQTASSTSSSQRNHIKPQLSDDVVLSDDEFPSPTPDDTLIVEEPSYTIVPKSDDSTDIDLEWTDVGAEDRVRARAKVEERKKKELKERQERELQERRKKEEEQRIREEERKRAETEHKRALEERRVQEERERKQREEDERRRKEEEQRKREEAERKLRENYETAARTREERARDAERKKQEALRIQERRKLEIVIQERDEREQALQERLNVLEDEQQVFAIQIRELMEHSEFLKNQNRVLQEHRDRRLDEQKTFEDQVRDSSTAHLSRFLNSNSIKTNKSVEQEVVMLLDILNSEVYQAAACIADLLETRSQLPMTSGPGGAEESRLTKVIGKGLTEVLKARTIEGAYFDPLIVQVAIQMCMNHCCAKIIRSWCPGMWNYSDFLSTLYTGIRATEDSATANKWRAVTHAQFRQNENTKTSMTHFLIEHLMSLLTFIGLPDSSKSWVTELLEERCPIIVGPALHINNAIFEDAGSDRLDIVLVRPDELFDTFTMENSFGRNGETGEVVVATADLGFRRIAGDYLAVSHLVKPKVVLSSAFDADTRHILELSG
ncbi:hypothetical protein M378DRAFT_13152 [Amanita muscaria Koide BX008]|uniref:Uncharacterized protein n=1 Tax=Amanita muscaria (strain Koide BX008) TaxID=946122 RepID=A0A0C2WYL6_AMAMK|nr:hypothetical protein M378DRAFT_13152 [Amanita muscaria Koide BX008]